MNSETKGFEMFDDGGPADKPMGASMCARLSYALADAMLKEKKSGDDVITNLEKEIEALHAELQCAEAIARATDGQDADDRKIIDEMDIEIVALRAKVSSLAVHLKRVIGDHNAPHDCFSTGPLTGTAEDDLCPACEALRLLDMNKQDGASGSVVQSDGELVAAQNNPHKWDNSDGERCEVCGDKDWFAGPVCNPPIDLSGLVEYLAREADYDRYRLENNLHQMSELWVKCRWAHVANLEKWAKGVSQLTTMPAARSKT